MCENILSIYAYICWVYAVRPGVGSKLSEYMERAQIKRGGNAVLGILYKFVFTLFFFFTILFIFSLTKCGRFFCFFFAASLSLLASCGWAAQQTRQCVCKCVCSCVFVCVCVWGQKLRFLFVLFYCFSYLWKAKTPRMWSLLLLPLLLLTGNCDSSRRVQRTMWNVFRLLACLCVCVWMLKNA